MSNPKKELIKYYESSKISLFILSMQFLWHWPIILDIF